MLKEDIEKLIKHKNEKIMITYPTLFLKYIEEAEEEDEAIYSQIASWEWSFEEWFKEEKYVRYFMWEKAVEQNPDLANDYRQYIRKLMEHNRVRPVTRMFERFHNIKCPPFGFSQEEWEEYTLLSSSARLVTTYLRCSSPEQKEYDIDLLEEVKRRNPHIHIQEWCDLLIKSIQLKELLKNKQEVEELLQEIQKCPSFEVETVGYFIPLVAVQTEMVNMLCVRGEIGRAAYILKTIGDKNVFRYDIRRIMNGHLKIGDFIQESYAKNIQPALLNHKANHTDEELRDLIYLYMNSSLRVRIDIMDVARYVAENQGRNLYQFFKDYPLDGKISYIDKLGDSLLVEPYLFSAYSEGRIQVVSQGNGKYEQKMLNADIDWLKKNLRKLDYAHLDDSCTFYLSDIRNGRIFVKDIVVCDRDEDGKIRFSEMSESRQTERRESFIREVLQWIDQEVVSNRHYVDFFRYHEKNVKNRMEAAGEKYAGKHSVRCAQPENLSNHEIREELAAGIVHAFSRAKSWSVKPFFNEIQGGGFLRGANECRYVQNEFMTSKIFNISDETRRKQVLDDATNLFLRDDILTEDKLKIYFNTILKHMIPIEELHRYGNDSFKTEYGKHLGRYWISLYVKGNGLRIPEYRGEGNKRKAPYSTKYRMVYVNGDVPLQGKGYGRIGEVDVEKEQLQIKELKTKEELKDQFAAYNRLLLDFKKMDNFDDAYHWFESVTENYSHIDIKEGLMRNVRNIAGTLDEIVIGMEGVGAEEFCCLLSYMDIIENNPFSWKEYQGDIQRWVNRNSDFRQKLQDGLEKFVKLQENQEVEEDILKSIYALGYYKYIVSEEDFIKKIIH